MDPTATIRARLEQALRRPAPTGGLESAYRCGYVNALRAVLEDVTDVERTDD